MRKAMGKSIWKGRDDQQVNVETVALQHYEALGYKGYVAEFLRPFAAIDHLAGSMQKPEY